MRDKPMNSEFEQIRADVFNCVECAKFGVFVKSSVNGRFYKFPPIIGGQRGVDLLFIGINPRRSESNLKLHEWLVESPDTFARLSANRQMDGTPYISPDGEEAHYHCHMIIVEAVFGVGTPFEARAAVTELMCCASAGKPLILDRMKSPCAALYLRRVLGILQPKVIVAVGSGVRSHLEQHFNGEIHVPIVVMEHPRQLIGMTGAEKSDKLQPVIDEIRQAVLQNGGAFPLADSAN